MSERQAEDRAHRLGQTKEVTVYRLVLKNSIDEHILQLAQSKSALSDKVMEEGKFVESDNTQKSHRLVESMLARALGDDEAAAASSTTASTNN